MILFKKKKIQLDIFTYRADAFNLFKIDHARKFLPDWWKDLPKTYVESNAFYPSATMKGCAGFAQYYKQGFIIPLWTDVAMEVGPENSMMFRARSSDGITRTMAHPSDQRGSYLNPNQYSHLKIASPWFMSCKEEVQWMFMQPMWNQNSFGDFMIPPGVLEFKYQGTSNINMFIKHTEEQRNLLIPAGTPVAHIVPLSDREVNLNVHLVSNEEAEKMFSKNSNISFLGKYNKIKNILKKQETEKRCPFGFK
jgi:hypothetical protein